MEEPTVPIPTNNLNLQVRLPGHTELIEGTWRLWLETHDGIAIDDNGDGIGGQETLPTVAGVLDKDLLDTTAAAFDPSGAHWRASFVSTDRRVRLKSEPFLMDVDKRFEDIFTAVNGAVTPSVAAEAVAARTGAEAAEAAAEAAAADAADAAGAAIAAFLASYVSPTPLVEDAADPGTFVIQTSSFHEDPVDPGTYLIGA
jgi:hypothetical protein